MRTLTHSELSQWCRFQTIELDDQSVPGVPYRSPLAPSSELHTLRCALPQTVGQVTPFCGMIEGFLRPREHCLFWPTLWGVWPSSENWHLYYRMRQSYCDHRLISEAPGHLFLGYETPDLISFIEVGLLAGWDIHLIPTVGYGRVFVSHDEWVLFAANHGYQIDEMRDELEQAGIKILDDLTVS